MTKREWIQAILQGRKDVPIAQHWIGYFNGQVARRLTPESCHYDSMWWYDVPDHFDMSAMGPEQLDKMIALNDYTGRCFACLGKGANISFGHGGPGEFFVRIMERDERGLIAEFETGVRAKIQFNPHFYHSYNHPVKNLDDFKRLELPDPAAAERYKGFAQDAQYLKSKGEYVVGSLNGFFSALHYFFMDYQDVLMALIAEPGLTHAMVERLGQWNLTAAEHMIRAGADCITLCDDLGFKDSLLMAPDLYRSFFKPWHQELCRKAHQMGAAVHLHSHGAIQPILDDLADCGFDFINPFDPEEGHVIAQTLARYADRFVVVGGFATQFWNWSAAQQHSYLTMMAELGREYGRLIFMDSGGVPENITRADYERITEVSRSVRGVDRVPGCV